MHANSEYSLLANAEITPTPNRLLILRLFLTKRNAFSLSSASEELFFMEKSTIYRTLQLLESNKILHSVITEDSIKNYALCAEECRKDNHAHKHAHLKCNVCELLYCIPVTSPPVLKANTGVQIDSLYILANGTCEECNGVAL